MTDTACRTRIYNFGSGPGRDFQPRKINESLPEITTRSKGMEIVNLRKPSSGLPKSPGRAKDYTTPRPSAPEPQVFRNSLNPRRISDFFVSGRRFAPKAQQFVLMEEKIMRRISGLLAPCALTLFLMGCAAIAGCSASGRVRVSNPDHDANHFTSNGGYQQHSDGRAYSK